MTRWEYRVRPTNLTWGEAPWRDAGDIRVQSVRDFSDLQFRRKPRRSVVAAIRRRAGNKQQRGEGR